jgi:hypothetical protein
MSWLPDLPTKNPNLGSLGKALELKILPYLIAF